jgi:hypothetical protein
VDPNSVLGLRPYWLANIPQLCPKLFPAYNPSAWTMYKTLLIFASVAACTAIGANYAENTAFQLVHWCGGSCLAMVVVLFVSQSLPIHHLACILNSLQAYCYFFSEGCACDICSRSCLPSPWHSSHGDYSPTAPAHPKWFHAKVRASQDVLPSSSCGQYSKSSESGRCSYISCP